MSTFYECAECGRDLRRLDASCADPMHRGEETGAELRHVLGRVLARDPHADRHAFVTVTKRSRPHVVYLGSGRTDDVADLADLVRQLAAVAADEYAEAIDWTIEHKADVGAPSSWSGTARPGDRRRSAFDAVTLLHVTA